MKNKLNLNEDDDFVVIKDDVRKLTSRDIKTKQKQNQKTNLNSSNKKVSNVKKSNEVDWSVLSAKLPTSKSDKTKRKNLFKLMDTTGTECLSLREAYNGVRDVLQCEEIADAKHVIKRAYDAAKNQVPSIKKDGKAYTHIKKQQQGEGAIEKQGDN